MRVTLDTSVLISALITPSGTSAEVYRKWREDCFDLVLSLYILDELQRILTHKIKFKTARVQEIINLLAQLAIIVDPIPTFHSRVMPNDLPILGTAYAGHARYLVTGDRALLLVGQFEKVSIVQPRQFLHILNTL